MKEIRTSFMTKDSLRGILALNSFCLFEAWMFVLTLLMMVRMGIVCGEECYKKSSFKVNSFSAAWKLRLWLGELLKR